MARPLTATAYGNAQIDTAQKKSGTGSLLLDGSGDYVQVDQPNGELDDTSGGWTIECWVRLVNAANVDYTVASAARDFTASTGQPYANWLFRIELENGTNNSFIRFSTSKRESSVTTSGAIDYKIGTISTATWIHLAVVSNGTNTLQLYVDGDLKTNNTSAARTSLESYHTVGSSKSYKPMYIGYDANATGGPAYYNGHIDQFKISSVRRYNGNFTPSAVLGADDNTLCYFKFDGDDGSTTFEDTLAISAASTIASQFTLPNVVPKLTKGGDCDMASQADLSAQPTGVILGVGTFESKTTASLTGVNKVAFIDPLYVQDGYADPGYFYEYQDQIQTFVTETTLAVDAGYLLSSASALSMLTVQTADAANTVSDTLTFSSVCQFAPQGANQIGIVGYYVDFGYVDPNYTLNIGLEPIVIGDLTLTAQGNFIFGGEASITAASSLTSLAGYQISAASSVSSETVSQFQGNATFSASTNLFVDSVFSGVAGKLIEAQASVDSDTNLSGTASVEIIPDANVFGSSLINIDPNVNIVGNVNYSADADLAFGINPNATAGILFNAASSVLGEFDTFFYPGQTISGDANLLADIQTNFTGGRLFAVEFANSAESAILAVPKYTAGGVSLVNSSFGFSVEMTYAEFGALLSFGQFSLTADITLYKIDPFRTLMVPSETRLYEMLAETAVLTPESETRINIVKPENAILEVSSETRIYKMPIPPIDIVTNRRSG